MNPNWEPDLLFYTFIEMTPEFQKPHDTYSHWAGFIVDEGGFDYQLGNLTPWLKAERNDWIIVPPDTIFRRVTSGLSFHFFGFDWKGRSPQRLDEVTSAYGRVRPGHTRRFRSTTALLRESMSDHSPTAQLYRKHLLRDLWLLHVLETHQQSLTVPASDNPLARRALRLLREHSATGPAVNAAAYELGLSPVQLNRLFRKEFQMTPSEYVQRIRMEKVKQLLEKTPLTLSDIAERCGFADEHHLSKSFKKSFGINPSIYRKSHTIHV
ncbi:AraC-type DNA-binding protein [Paenibacillaceae bacterium GAS479]|nr:AraC-type DNA-binding protein [Paenibacillaceae bacterium GAS479]